MTTTNRPSLVEYSNQSFEKTTQSYSHYHHKLVCESFVVIDDLLIINDTLEFNQAHTSPLKYFVGNALTKPLLYTDKSPNDLLGVSWKLRELNFSEFGDSVSEEDLERYSLDGSATSVEYTFSYLSGYIDKDMIFTLTNNKPSFSNKKLTDNFYYTSERDAVLEEIVSKIRNCIFGERYVRLVYRFSGSAAENEIFLKVSKHNVVFFENEKSFNKESHTDIKNTCYEYYNYAYEKYKDCDIRNGSYASYTGEKPYYEKVFYLYGQDSFTIRDYTYQGVVTERVFSVFVIDL